MNKPQQFRKRPVVVEAIQWTGRNQTAVTDFCSDLVRLNSSGTMHLGFEGRSVVEPQNNKVLIRTLEGVMEASAGDWIIRGVKGEYYPCKPDIFAATYAAVPTDDERSQAVARLASFVSSLKASVAAPEAMKAIWGGDDFAATLEVVLASVAPRSEDADAAEAIENAWEEAFQAYCDGCGAPSAHDRARKILVARLLPLLRVHEFAIARLQERIKTMDETHGLQLAGISTATIQNTERTIKDRIGPENPYHTVAYADVCRAVDREMKLRAENARMCNRVHHGEHTENCPFCATKPNGPGVPNPMCHLCDLESERDTLRAECERLKKALEKQADYLAELEACAKEVGIEPDTSPSTEGLSYPTWSRDGTIYREDDLADQVIESLRQRKEVVDQLRAQLAACETAKAGIIQDVNNRERAIAALSAALQPFAKYANLHGSVHLVGINGAELLFEHWDAARAAQEGASTP